VKPFIDIAIGILKNQNKICLSLRQKHQSHADHWEFPGGKKEANETLEQALIREFKEELAVETKEWKKLIEIPWHYEKVSVRLHVYQTTNFMGEPIGNEGQKVQWFTLNELANLTFPTANKGIITALQLADQYMISGAFGNADEAITKFTQALENGLRFCQLRAKNITDDAFAEVAIPAIQLCHSYNAKLLLNGKIELLDLFPQADGLQLASNEIYKFKKRPIPLDKWLGVSVHTDEDIVQALKLNADFLLLSPVKETTSHPGVPGLGWDVFAQKAKDIPVPVFALGGMKSDDLNEAKKHGAHGIAAISGFWSS